MIISNKLCFVMDKYDFSLYDLMDSFYKKNQTNQNGGTIRIENNKITDENSNKCDETYETKKLQNPELDKKISDHCFSDNKINPENYFKLFNTIMKQVATGLKQIHESGFIHFDIKPANIMINGLLDYETEFDTYLTKIHVYIINFELAQYIEKGESIKLDEPTGTPLYLPYESFVPNEPDKAIWETKTLTRKVDIFSFGKTYYNIYKTFYLKYNIQNYSNNILNLHEENKIKKIIENHDKKWYSTNFDTMNEYFKNTIGGNTMNEYFKNNTIVNTIKNCLDKDRNIRPEAEDLETVFTDNLNP
jgi:serine/threonine protein kinase